MVEEEETPVEDELENKRPGCTWVYGINDHLDAPEDLGTFQPDGIFRKDFAKFCDSLGAVPHATLGPQRNTPKNDASHETTLCVSSTLVDHFSIKVLQLLLPTSLYLETLIFSNCRLDMDMVGLLRKGLGAEGCTVHNLQLEWNPLEVPLELAGDSNPPSEGACGDGETARSARSKAQAGDGSKPPLGEEDWDQLELRRDLKQCRRILAVVQDFIFQKFGSMEAAWEAIESSRQGAEKLHVGPFAEIADEVLGLHASEAADAFEVLDGIHFGMAEGKVSLKALQNALQDLPEPDGFDVAQDPLGDAFASFVDAGCMLECLSLRGCGISRKELVPIAAMVAAESRHLTILNLYGNRICDRGVEYLVTALQENRGIEYLGLGQNRITDVGLACLVKGLGPEAVSADDEAEIRAQVDAKAAEVAAKQVRPPLVDANGRELHERPMLCDELEEQEDPATGEVTLIRKKPSELKTLNVSENAIKDAEAIQVLQFQGDGIELVLRQTPAARILTETKELQEKGRRHSMQPQQECGHGGWKLIL